MERLANTICVIEDNLSIRKLYSILLIKAGFEVIEFDEGLQAVEWIAKKSPLAVICDDGLPDTNGTEVLNKIRQLSHGKKMPVVAVTGFAQESDRERYLQSGFNGYIAKPINTSTFVEQIREIINTTI